MGTAATKRPFRSTANATIFAIRLKPDSLATSTSDVAISSPELTPVESNQISKRPSVSIDSNDLKTESR